MPNLKGLVVTRSKPFSNVNYENMTSIFDERLLPFCTVLIMTGFILAIIKSTMVWYSVILPIRPTAGFPLSTIDCMITTLVNILFASVSNGGGNFRSVRRRLPLRCKDGYEGFEMTGLQSSSLHSR